MIEWCHITGLPDFGRKGNCLRAKQIYPLQTIRLDFVTFLPILFFYSSQYLYLVYLKSN